LFHKEDLLYYTLGPLLVPLLPLLYWQGKQIIQKVPRLPEAKGNEGCTKKGSQKQRVVLGLGESTMAGVGVAHQNEGFIGNFCEALQQQTQQSIVWEVVAKSGIKAEGVCKRLLPKIKTEQPDLIVIALGGNDAFALRSPRQWARDSTALVHALREKFAPQTPIVFTNMPPIRYFPAFTPLIQKVIGGLVDLYRNKWRRYLSSFHNVYFNDEIIHFSTWNKRYQINVSPETLFSDGVHPSRATYQLWGQDMAQFCKEKILQQWN
jgi:lysophospholipase L1-like esterase